MSPTPVTYILCQLKNFLTCQISVDTIYKKNHFPDDDDKTDYNDMLVSSVTLQHQ